MSLATREIFPPPSTIDRSMECELINAFWPHLCLSTETLLEDHYTRFLDFVLKTLTTLSPHAADFAIRDFGGLFIMIDQLRDNPGATRQEIKISAQARFLNTPDEAVFRSIELAAMLWLGLNICSQTLAVGPRNPRDSRINWKELESLQTLVDEQISHRSSQQWTNMAPLFDSMLTVVNLRNICRLKIRWTSNLADHLRLEGPRGQRILSIYQHKICLINHRLHPDSSPIREEILEDTIRTFDLLFPFGDHDTKEFLKQQGAAFHSLGSPVMARFRDGQDFGCWNANLSRLSSLLHGPPETVLQTLLDKRNLNQWVTLWVSIVGLTLVTVIFGVIATVYAIKQYQVALDSYELSVKSFQLSVAIACQQRTAQLPGFCES